MADLGSDSHRFEQRSAGRLDHREPRPRVAQEVVDFILGVRDIDGDEYGAQIQAGEVQQYRIHGLVDLGRHAIALFHSPGSQSGRESGGSVGKPRVTQFAPFGSTKKWAVRSRSGAVSNPIGGILRG